MSKVRTFYSDTDNVTTYSRFVDVLEQVEFPGYDFEVVVGMIDVDLRVVVDGKCNVSGEPWEWKGRRWRLSRYMTDGEIVQTAFLAIKTAEEHELRDKFTYRGVPIFGPHWDVDALVERFAEKERD